MTAHTRGPINDLTMAHNAFEKWLDETMGLDAEWDAERNCYKEFAAHLAWKAWQASPIRAATVEQATRAEAEKGGELADLLRKVVELADSQPFTSVGHMVEHVIPDIRIAALRHKEPR